MLMFFINIGRVMRSSLFNVHEFELNVPRGLTKTDVLPPTETPFPSAEATATIAPFKVSPKASKMATYDVSSIV
jgi:hypothetical protein